MTKFDYPADEEFRAFVDKVPSSCRITIVSDSCHSGGLLERAKEQIGNSTDTHHITEYGRENKISKNRSLPLSTLVSILEEKTGKVDIKDKELRTALVDIFGDESSITVKRQRDGEVGEGGLFCSLCSLVRWFLKNEEVSRPSGKYDGKEGRGISDNGVLISGCQTNQKSADVNPTGNPSVSYGALSDAIQKILAKSKGKVSNRELVIRARRMIAWEGFEQQPGLYCSDELAAAPFIC